MLRSNTEFKPLLMSRSDTISNSFSSRAVVRVASQHEPRHWMKIVSLRDTDNYGLVLHISVVSTKYPIRIMIVLVVLT